MAFRTAELDGKLIVVIDDCKLAAAVKTLDYAWQEQANTEEYIPQIISFLTQLYSNMTDETITEPSN